MENDISKYATVDIERELLYNFLFDSESRQEIIIKLKPTDFSIQEHRELFSKMIEIYNNQNDINYNLLKVNIISTNDSNKQELLNLLDIINVNVCTPDNVSKYIEIVSNQSIKLKIQKLAEKILVDEYDILEQAPIKFDEYLQELNKIINSKVSDSLTKINQFVDDALQRYEEIKKNKALLQTSTGFKSLDAFINGFKGPELMILAARPSIGKTALSLNFALNVAKQIQNSNECVVIFSLEMSASQLIDRFVSLETNLLISLVQGANLDYITENTYKEKLVELSKLNILIDEKPDITILDIQAKLKQLSRTNVIKLVIIDYLQLINVNSSSGSRHQDVAKISRTLKIICQELNIPILAVAQLSRNIEQRSIDDRKPKLSDLRESGSIEQDADIVMFLDYDRTKQENNKNNMITFSSFVSVELTIAKNRHGQTGITILDFDKRVGKFFDKGEKNEI